MSSDLSKSRTPPWCSMVGCSSSPKEENITAGCHWRGLCGFPHRGCGAICGDRCSLGWLVLVLQDHAPGRLRLPLLLYSDKAKPGWSVCSRERSPTHAEVTVVILPALRHSRIHFPQLFSPPSSTGQRCEPRGAQWLPVGSP